MKFNPAFLFLQDGTYYQGWSLSKSLFSFGEIVFNTAMTGYQEVITDPSYCDQIILFTYPELGNTGVNLIDIESTKIYASGLIAKNICLRPNSWRMKYSLFKYLVSKTMPHIFGIDTRYLAKYLRSKGVMYACISSQKVIVNIWSNYIADLTKVNIVRKVTTQKRYIWKNNKRGRTSSDKNIANYNMKRTSPHVIVVDFGLKLNILRRLSSYGCNVTVVPAFEAYDKMLARKPDGILLSNGPGDPSVILFARYTISRLLETNVPIFGICLGHQLLSLSLGATTSKMRFGHRGVNHPASMSGKVQLTSQNHGFVVDINKLPLSLVNVMSFNLNDKTVGGIIHKNKPCFSVQYHPEASPGPRDTDHLFHHFIQVMRVCSLRRNNKL